MAHVRRTFLEDLRGQLAQLSGYGGAWIQRVAPTKQAYPAITVFADSETVEFNTIGPSPRCQNRYLTVCVVVWIKSAVDDEKVEIMMDEAALDIERNIRDPIGCDDFYLVATDFQFSEDDVELSAVTLTYKVEYATNEFDPEY